MGKDQVNRIFLKFRYSIILVCLLSGITGKTQQVIGTVSGLYITHFDEVTKTHYQFFKDSVALVNLRGELIRGFRSPDLHKFVVDYQPVICKGEILLIHMNGGLVQRITEKGIDRIDKSYENRVQAGSVIFIRNDTVFRHGGYGMWSARRELIYFNTSTSEWEIYKLSKESGEPPALFCHFGYLAGDKLLVLGGLTIDPVDPFVFKWVNRKWEFDFSTRKWLTGGELIIRDGNGFYPISGREPGDRVLALNQSLKCLRIDFSSERVTTFETNPLSLEIPRSNRVQPFVADDHLYFYRSEFPHQQARKLEETVLNLCRIPLKDFMLRETEQANLIQTSLAPEFRRYLAFGGGLFALLIGVAIRRRIKQKTLLKLHGMFLKSGRQELPLTEQEAAVIRLLLEAREDVTTNHLLEITSNPEQDHSYNLRTNKQLIEKLNDDMALLLGIDSDLITTERMRSDRRIRKYTIRKEFFRT